MPACQATAYPQWQASGGTGRAGYGASHERQEPSGHVNRRSGVQVTVGVLVVAVGLLIGAMLARVMRPSSDSTQLTQQTQQTRQTQVAIQTPPRRAASPAPTYPSPASLAPAAATTAPTPEPPPPAPQTPMPTRATATPIPATPTPATPTPAAPAPAASIAKAAVAPVAGVWRIEEANVYDGTIVWSGAGTASSDGTLVLDIHKVRVGGHAVSQCERETRLYVALAGTSPQNAPYREVNCSGVTSNGEMRVTGFGAGGRSFSGSFWLDGAKAGDFTALRT